jgi:hypothetical protein
VLAEGMVFPCDFGFVPQTNAETATRSTFAADGFARFQWLHRQSPHCRHRGRADGKMHLLHRNPEIDIETTRNDRR